MRNLISQLENKGEEFMNCFPKSIFQKETFIEHRLILLLANRGANLEDINKITKLLKAILDIEEIIRPIRIIINWNKIIKKMENQLN